LDEIFVEGFGVSVSKKSERLVVRRKGEVISERPFFDVERVIVSTEGATISSSAIHECVKYGIPMEFISYSGIPYASLVSPSLGGTVKTRRAQLLSYEDRRGVELGKAFATGKLKNSANNLKYYAKYRKGADRAAYDFVYRRVDKLEDLLREIAEIEGSRVDEARGALLNTEGRGAALYWEGIKRLVPDFHGREGRGATDLVNSLLNYGYGILYNRVLVYDACQEPCRTESLRKIRGYLVAPQLYLGARIEGAARDSGLHCRKWIGYLQESPGRDSGGLAANMSPELDTVPHFKALVLLTSRPETVEIAVREHRENPRCDLLPGRSPRGGGEMFGVWRDGSGVPLPDGGRPDGDLRHLREVRPYALGTRGDGLRPRGDRA